MKKKFFFRLFIITSFILAIFFRLYNYPYRIAIVSDHSRDVQVARFAFDHRLIPQIGQFSSAGPFFYGPWWYWFLELITVIPFGQLTHWYIMTSLSLVFVFLMYFLGMKIGGKWLGVTCAFLSAISPAQIINSFAVWNPAIIPFLSLTMIILLVKCYEKKSLSNFFFLGFILGLSLTIHFQSILLLPVLATGLYLGGRRLKNQLFLLLGLILPFVPLIYFDLRFNWFNFRNIWWYLTVGQYNIWVPNRWLTYIGKYWPEAWGEIIGGTFWLGAIIITLLSLFTLLILTKFRKYSKFYLTAITFILSVILFRYYRGERFFYYSFFAHPYVILFTAWVVYHLFKKNKILGLILLSLISFYSIKRGSETLSIPDIHLEKILSTKKTIYEKYPQETFDIYGCQSTEGNLVSYPLAYFMYLDGRNHPSGRKIKVCYGPGQTLSWRLLTEEEIKMKKTGYNRTTEQIFKETAEWWKENPPK